MIWLRMFSDPRVAVTQIEPFAAGTLKNMGVAQQSRVDPESIDGHAGEAFTGIYTKPDGYQFPIVAVFAKLDGQHLAVLMYAGSLRARFPIGTTSRQSAGEARAMDIIVKEVRIVGFK
jgi:hypothetical protein